MEELTLTRWEKFKNTIRRNLLTFLLIASIVLGCVVGILVRAVTRALTDSEERYVKIPGEILVRMLKCSAIPLVMACIIVALSSLDISTSRRICWQLIVIVFAVKICSGVIGLVYVIVIHPGTYGSIKYDSVKEEAASAVEDNILDMIRNIFPANMIRIYVQQFQTKLISENATKSDARKMFVAVGYINNMNVLGMVFIASVIGITLSIMKDNARGLLQVSRDVYFVSMTIATWVLWISPIFIFFLIFAAILQIKDVPAFFSTWGMFVLTVLVAHTTLFVVLFPTILFIITRTNPFKLYQAVLPALITAFATASSLAAMPILVECLMRYGLDKSLVQFVVPVGININKDGAACHIVASTVFLMQFMGITLSWGEHFTILVLAILGSLAVAGVPFSAIVVLLMIFNGLGYEPHLVFSVMVVEWFIDRTSTVCNIAGNSTLVMIIAKWNKNELSEVGTKED